MSLRKALSRAICISFATVVLPAGAARADEPKITLSGQLDWYYQISMNHPPAGSVLMGRAWDVKADSFSLGLLEINANRQPTAEHPVGFGASIIAGKTADLYNGMEPGGLNTYRHIGQLYGSFLVGGKRPITIDFGKFQSWVCSDQMESTSSDNYSRSLLYTLGEPFYHAGLRASAMLNDRWMLNLYLVNGWNNIEDDNGGKSIGFMLMTMGKAPWNVMFNYIGGNEGSTTANSMGTFGGVGFWRPVELNVQMFDLVATLTPDRHDKFTINADYADASKSGQAGGHWSGVSLTGRRQLPRGWAVALRGEHFEDTNGLRTGMAQNVNEITATLERAMGEHLLMRLEYRHDHAGSMFFPTNGGMSQNQDTVTFAQVIRF